MSPGLPCERNVRPGLTLGFLDSETRRLRVKPTESQPIESEKNGCLSEKVNKRSGIVRISPFFCFLLLLLSCSPGWEG